MHKRLLAFLLTLFLLPAGALAQTQRVFMAGETAPFGADERLLTLYVCPIMGADSMLLTFEAHSMLVDMGKKEQAEDVLAMQQQVKGTYASPEVRAYVAAICAATRNTPYLTLGASTRAAIALVRAAQGNALLCGRDYIIPEDVQRMAAPVLCHRFVLSADARMRGYTEQQVLSELMGGVRIPVRLK